MARTRLAATKITTAGLTPAPVAGTVDGHSFKPTRTTFVLLRNSGAAPVNVTFPTPATVRGKAIAEDVQAVPAGGQVLKGPFDTEYLQGDGSVHVDYAAPADTAIAVLDV